MLHSYGKTMILIKINEIMVIITGKGGKIIVIKGRGIIGIKGGKTKK